MSINFDECGRRFANDAELQGKYGWGNRPIIGIERNYTSQITLEGCLRICGSGMDLYPWKDVSGVITTWILPVIGVLLQAPFESNATRRTLLAITRWVGSPIASLSYVLWNIKVSAKAAMMVDMAVNYDETPHRKTDFGSMRDSMYLLLVMNQYTLKPTAMSKDLQKEAEGLLRITLFSKDLILTDTDKTLRQMRRILAREVREMRRRGTVPVFVSIMWFLFAFALSIQDAFANLGANSTAHDLALGCLLAWFPVLIMGSIFDRNPIAAEAIRKKLSTLVDHVRHALRDRQHRDEFIETFRDQPDYHDLKCRIESVANKGEYMEEFFVDFAGQARIRWHYGAAHAILSDIEDCYIEKRGRNWLANEREARASLVLGPVNEEGLVWFDVREFWQVLSAIIIVGGSCGGAFILSYFTPTVGLGCRSGGYTIFFSVALGLLIVEMTVWMFLSPYKFDAPWLARAGSHLHSHVTFNHWEDDAHERWRRLKRRTSGMLDATGSFLIRCIVSMALIALWTDREATKERVESRLERMRTNLREMPTQRKWEVFFFRPIEIFNTIWLIYIVMAQVFGWYKTCQCMTSNWAWGGGYLDFNQQDQSNSLWVAWCWLSGTVLTATVMGLSMFYITVEQSFLSTEDYEEAMKGLRMTRTYRSWTLFARHTSRVTLTQLEKLALAVGLIKKRQKTLMWTRHHTWNPHVPRQASPSGRDHFRAVPSIELTPYDDDRVPSAAFETPAMAHSLFPPAITPRRTRNKSDASLDPLDLPGRPRTSGDSSTPLVQRPSQVYQQHEVDGSMIGEERRSSETPSLGPRPMRSNAQTWLHTQDAVQNRQGYHRARSDPGFPLESGDAEHSGLGISSPSQYRNDR
ncbi:hypothetical protein G6011_04532 [Alternaria panax]|uniref:Uncharacterized protein n=1 Tax=Alternaria panax TaxID=48097 RepID=A0AAD4NTZ9_9PLEO|nr:hypothetical protein G6011_04532 [Alternaria panax]